MGEIDHKERAGEKSLRLCKVESVGWMGPVGPEAVDAEADWVTE